LNEARSNVERWKTGGSLMPLTRGQAVADILFVRLPAETIDVARTGKGGGACTAPGVLFDGICGLETGSACELTAV
jgi:hypothetical protein